VNSFIVTLASSTLIGGLVSLYTKDQTILNGIPNSLQTFGNGVTLGVPRPAWVVIVVAAAVAYVFSMTPFGRALTQIGSSRRAARLVGLRVEALTWSSFVGSGALAGVAGVIELTRTGSGNPVIGFGFTLSALSAAFLGTTTIRPGRFNVPGTLVGVLVVAVAVNGLTLAGAADWVEPVFTGAALMFAVALATQLGLRRGGASEQ
jgi:ribose transport system permease protein